jgi:hypothetical protein
LTLFTETHKIRTEAYAIGDSSQLDVCAVISNIIKSFIC